MDKVKSRKKRSRPSTVGFISENFDLESESTGIGGSSSLRPTIRMTPKAALSQPTSRGIAIAVKTSPSPDPRYRPSDLELFLKGLVELLMEGNIVGRRFTKKAKSLGQDKRMAVLKEVAWEFCVGKSPFQASLDTS